MATLTDQDRAQLETQFVDVFGLDDVIEALAAICAEKEEHLEHNWQDRSTAQVWAKASHKLNKLSFGV